MAYNTIILAGNIAQEEREAAAALSPGHVLEKTSANKYQKHTTEGGFAAPLVALEDALQGKTVADAYSAADRVTAGYFKPGDMGQLILKAGETAVIGSNLVSGGDGTVVVDTNVSSGTTVKKVLAIAEEALDLSASGSSDTLLAVRFI